MPFHSPRIASSSKSSSLEWKCPFCGAMNEEDNMVCDGCGDPRPNSDSSSPGPKRGSGSNKSFEKDDADSFDDAPPDLGSDLDSDKEFEDNKAKGVFGSEDDKEEEEDLEESPKAPEPLETEKETEKDTEEFDSSTVITSPLTSSKGPLEEDEDEDSGSTSVPSFTPPPAPTLSSTTTASGGEGFSSDSQRLYLVFVNTPAASLVKSRVGIEFDVFSTVSIGRNPENVVVVPDAEVSRSHAQLTLENGRIMLKDLKSANGTFVYDGKQFQRVNGSVEVKPNTILKFGSGTIVRLVAE